MILTSKKDRVFRQCGYQLSKTIATICRIRFLNFWARAKLSNRYRMGSRKTRSVVEEEENNEITWLHRRQHHHHRRKILKRNSHNKCCAVPCKQSWIEKYWCRI